MKKFKKIIVILVIVISLSKTSVNAHGGNITGWKDKDSDKITYHDGKNYGYHKQGGTLHYHEVEWNELKQKWEIIKTAVCYDENFNVINNTSGKKSEKIQVEFVEKVDGDTAKFKLNGENITVRFLGIDTPETVHPTKGEEPFGKEASNFSETSLKNAQKIEIEYEENCSKFDKYNRHLAWIFVDDVLLQNELVKNGLAKTYMLQDNYKYAGLLQESEMNAQKQGVKIWNNEKESLSKEENQVDEISSEIIDLKEEIIIILCGVIGFLGFIIKYLKKKLFGKKVREKWI